MDEDMKPPASGSGGNGSSLEAGDSGARPLLSTYYGDPKLTAAAFVRQVKAAAAAAQRAGDGPVTFDSEDAQQVLERLNELDPWLARTGALRGKGPPFRNWVERVTEAAHKQCMDGAGSEYPTVMERFRCFLDRTAGDLLGKDAVRKRRTGNLVRLVFVWMVERQKTGAGARLAAGMAAGFAESEGPCQSTGAEADAGRRGLSAIAQILAIGGSL